MFRKTLLWALGLFFAYNLALYVPAIRDRFLPQSQWQENLVKAQDYLSETRPIHVVIVGSSLAARLENSLGEDACNLALAGGSSATGLELVCRKTLKPRIVLIETNLITKNADASVLDNAFRPVFSQLRVVFPAFRERFQPANFLAGKVGEKIVGLGTRSLESLANRKDKAKVGASDVLFQQLLQKQRAEYGAAPGTAELEEACARLERYVNRLADDHVQVALLELPVHRELMTLPRFRAIRQTLEAKFPPDRFRWIEAPASFEIETSDALHLNADCARALARNIRGQLENETPSRPPPPPPL